MSCNVMWCDAMWCHLYYCLISSIEYDERFTLWYKTYCVMWVTQALSLVPISYPLLLSTPTHSTFRYSGKDIPDTIPVTTTPLVPLNLLRDPGFLDLLIASFVHPTKQLPHTSHVLTAKLLAVSCGSHYEENPELGTNIHVTFAANSWSFGSIVTAFRYCRTQYLFNVQLWT
jgi:hypothetical protein